MFAGIVVIVATDDDPSATPAVLLRVLTLLGASLLVALWLRPLFDQVRAWTRTFIVQSRQYGFGIYVGRVLSVGTFNIDVLLLAALTDAKTVAVYSLARALSTFAAVPADGVAAALFARMTTNVDSAGVGYAG